MCVCVLCVCVCTGCSFRGLFNNTYLRLFETQWNSLPAVVVYRIVIQPTEQRQYQTRSCHSYTVRLQFVTVQSQVQCRTASCDIQRAHSGSQQQAQL